jgi:hypothetical protein
MQPTVILLLGAFAPNADDGTIVGSAAPAAANAERFKNSRRDILLFGALFLLICSSPM